MRQAKGHQGRGLSVTLSESDSNEEQYGVFPCTTLENFCSQSISQSSPAMQAADKTRGSTAKVSTVIDAAPMRRYQASKPDDTASLISWVITHLTHRTTNIRPSPSARP
ncbi:hypothetical protein CPAR01_14193 [Colletotrichum paranaense]|uniref:Uncharacterized protein n=1 Tax=Colletotrichum paranaense TaxID=1914294 RepID=A0ABQ9S3G1_9PEZI|nr:uncharacterized protein CPAR01_14193 [Colletotrichum paranaense]KAK1523340.1 hypothetical protein CPAR01_14193 [Colletotrichum paranaense]